MAYSITWHKRGAYKKFNGHITAGEFMESISTVNCHPDYDTFKFTVNDFLDVVSYDVSADDVTLFAAHGLGAKVSNQKVVMAIITKDAAITRIVQALYAPLTEYEIGYFSSLAETQEWLTRRTGIAVGL
jgi:protoheme ferro-lyase